MGESRKHKKLKVVDRLWGDDHSTGCTIAVARATSIAAAGCNGNDDGEEDYCTDNSAYNRSSAQNTRRFAFVVTTLFACTTLIVVLLHPQSLE
ncbi:hypothetical protein pdam_00015642 [Pocillopora damicornis]|uniref:Transmembrane protein n=1 Tax=Pocillopora damicornis TaxID=46731 RepID=A0A3M6UQM4_POCDA|nr:hypothetical protein pdam_00015642 [Pocillopora damicornis]